MAVLSEAGEKFERLVEVMKRLRAPDGCPWDSEQTYLSLRRYIIEEAYELIEAINRNDVPNMCEECGDLMLQSVFISAIAEEEGLFGISDVIQALTDKLVRRHPHVFGSVVAKDSETVLHNWEKIKAVERRERKVDSSSLAGIPQGLPSLLRAHRIQERASKVGFDWPKGDLSPIFAKVEEEAAELKEAITAEDKTASEEELGDFLFALVNLARHMHVDAEDALRKACIKFTRRFREVESSVTKSGREWKDFSLEELDKYWKDAKKR